MPVRGQGVLRLRAGELGAVPDVRRGGRRARAGPGASRDYGRTGREIRGHAVLRRSYLLRQHAACRPAGGCPRRGQAGRLGRRGAPGRPVPAVDVALRRRHPRRHRHDRDAAHLPVQPAGPGPGRHDRGRGARLRPARARRGRAGGPARDPRDPVRPGRVGRDRVLVALRRLAAGVPGGVAAHRGHLRGGRGRVLRLPRPHRGHAQGQRHLGLPGRGRGTAAGARRRGPGRGGGRQRHRRAGEAGGLRPAQPGRDRRRGRADRVLPGRAAVVQAAPPDRVRHRVPDHGHRQDPPGRAARAGRGDHAGEPEPPAGGPL